MNGNTAMISESVIILSCFCIGIVIGLISIVRLLSFCLKKYYDLTVAILIGFMIGSLRKVWPFKNGSDNILPQEFDRATILTILLALVGFATVIAIDKFAEKLENQQLKKED